MKKQAVNPYLPFWETVPDGEPHVFGDRVYIFGSHDRLGGDNFCHTHGTAYSRQGVAEKIVMNPDGTFRQAEMTSCGLNGGPLKAEGAYSAHIACHLTGPDREKVGQVVMSSPDGGELILPEDMPYITEEPREGGEHGLRPYIRNLQAGAVCGFQYFDFGPGVRQITVTVRGKGVIALASSADGEALSETAFACENWSDVSLPAGGLTGIQSVYFRVVSGKGDIREFTFGNL